MNANYFPVMEFSQIMTRPHTPRPPPSLANLEAEATVATTAYTTATVRCLRPPTWVRPEVWPPRPPKC